MSKLLPCPFCGSEALSVDVFMGSYAFVMCDACGTEGPTQYLDDDYCDTEEALTREREKIRIEAIEAWNKRAEEK